MSCDARDFGRHPLAHHPAPRYFAAEQKSAEWLARRPQIGGSSVAAVCGMLPYRDGEPGVVYLSLIGEGAPFNGNEHTAYGERYEPRLRRIAAAAFGIQVREYGLFVSRHMPFLGVSLDGETPAYRLWAWTDEAPARSRRLCWTLGKLVWEAKCSRAGLKPAPLVPHLLQITAQMAVRRRHAGLLQYWHRDKTRAWLVLFSHDLWRWMALRLALAHVHSLRRVPMTQASQFFPWLRYAGGRSFPGASCADYLQYAWFGLDPAPPKKTAGGGASATGRGPPQPPPRAQIALAHWRDQLATLRTREGARPAASALNNGGPDDASEPMSPVLGDPAPLPKTDPGAGGAQPPHNWEYGEEEMPWWDTDVPGGAECAPRSADDVVLQPLPPKPRVWLLYDYERPLAMRDVELMDPVCVKERGDEDDDWFAAHFPPAAALAAARLDAGHLDWAAPPDEDGLPPTALHFRGVGPEQSWMPRLFVERFEPVPALDEAEPVDDSANDTPAERAAFERRLVAKTAEAQRRGRAAPAPPEEPRARVPIDVDEHGLRRTPAGDELRALLSRCLVPQRK